MGSAYGARSPVEFPHPSLFAEAVLAPGAVLPLDPDYDERAVYVASGEIDIAGDTFGEGRLLVFKPGDRISILATTQSRLMLLGGEPMDSPRHIWWNFVSSSRSASAGQGGLARQALRARAGRREGVHSIAGVRPTGGASRRRTVGGSMEFGWLQQGSVKLIAAMPSALGKRRRRCGWRRSPSPCGRAGDGV